MRGGRPSRGTGPRRAATRGPRRTRPTGVAGVVLVLLVSLFGLVVARLGQVQLLDGAQLTSQASSVHTRTITEHALRGQILDRTGARLVTNAFTTVVTLERGVLLDADDGGRALVRSVAAVLGQPFDRLWGKTMLCGTVGAPRAPACFNGSPYVPIPIAAGVDPRRALTLMEQPEKFPGIGVTPEPARSYPAPSGVNAAHLLGWVARAGPADVEAGAGALDAEDVVGRSGLEQQYDSALRGRNGATVVAIDPRGVVTETLSSRPPVPGSDVVTHLDARLQARTEAVLAQTVARARAEGLPADAAAAVVLDVTNGAVVAAASNPAYDPDVFTGGISSAELERLSDEGHGVPLKSRVTGETFPPASTFKVISVPAAVASGARLTGTYDCSPSLTVGGRVFKNFESRGYGPIDLHRALVVSCDTVFYRLAYAAWQAQGGISAPPGARDRFAETARAFGIGRATGIDLPGESAGRLPDRAWKEQYWAATRSATCARARSGYPEVARTDKERAAYLSQLAVENCATGWQWRAGDAVNFSIGQGDLAVTPLQMAQVYSAIANGGTLWQPQVASGLRAPDGTVTPIAPRRTGTVGVPADVLAYVRAALADVTRPGGSAGTAWAGIPQDRYPVAGKTGTGEVFGKQATAWFAAFGPTTRPKYAVVVVVSQGASGSKVAAPAVRQIFDAILSLKM
ncbi:penicillin-binding protein 2 [Humibacillus xanthopallidus]|uniref:Penicillin-binding protein 2 n=1 Tax=Humibacillus xanthopallidus TaxID=412689 RepID=A0A543HWG4_9MICO|nr:penicillin-binding protein 2 [Humibacillus xanthopallidus]TQM62703.1 penicillin-binding protein 2 [Humibacillus xanthopallidus]